MELMKYPDAPLTRDESKAAEPRHRWVNYPSPEGWIEPVLSFWELTGEAWTDHHAQIEWDYIIEGQLFLEVDGVEMEFNKGDIARIPPGKLGRYRAPVYAKMLAVYGPNPAGVMVENQKLTKFSE